MHVNDNLMDKANDKKENDSGKTRRFDGLFFW
jgi:hypothetical protein